MKKTILRNYARLIVRTGANVQKGQSVMVYAGLDQPEFVETVVDECYRAGAAEVEVEEEVIAAIATALRIYRGALHDKESEVLTIMSIKRAYSPWNSKIHGLTQMPDRK